MLSVVIPTKDRREVLLETLAVLGEQEAPPGGTEVVVVDNGSSDGTADAVEELAESYPLPLKLVADPRPGPASARNTGTAVSAGEVILFLGDDTAPADGALLARHAALHAARPEPGYAVLGLVTWNPASGVTPFMRWLESSGIQFDFVSLDAGPVPVARSFCTAQVSVKREALDAAGGFDERFPDAAMEDVELGARLEDNGLELDYHPDLVALHTHPTEPPDSLKRLRRVGRSAALLRRVRPDDEDLVGVPSGPRWALLELGAPLWSGLSRLPDGPLRRLGWKGAHMRAFRRGFREGPPAEGR